MTGFGPSWQALIHAAVAAVLSFFLLILLIRAFGQRALAKWNAFGFRGHHRARLCDGNGHLIGTRFNPAKYSGICSSPGLAADVRHHLHSLSTLAGLAFAAYLTLHPS